MVADATARHVWQIGAPTRWRALVVILVLATIPFLWLLARQHKTPSVPDATVVAAVVAGDSSTLHDLLKHGGNPNARDWYGDTVLHLAVTGQHVDVTELLLVAGADTESGGTYENHTGFTPLHFAAMLGNIDIAECLLKHGAQINARCEVGLTPLHGAIMGGNESMVRYLLQRGADVTVTVTLAEREPPQTMAEFARMYGLKEIAGYLSREEEIQRQRRFKWK